MRGSFLAICLALSGVSLPGYAQDNAIRVQLKPKTQMLVAAQIAGRLQRLPFKEGDTFHKGDVIAAFDCAVNQARERHAGAATLLAQKKLAVAKRLNKLDSISLVEVEQAQADFSMAQAQQRIATIMVQRCLIKAPFSGRVAARMVEPGEFVSEGGKLLQVYSTSAYEVEMIVPSRWVTQIKTGQQFTVTLDETGRRSTARVTRLGGVIDALSQSFKVFGEIKASPGLLLMPGMSGSAAFSQQVLNDD